MAQSDSVLFAASHLHYFIVDIGDFDRQTLAKEVSVAQLTDLASTPRKDISRRGEGTSVGLTTSNINNVDPVETRDLPHNVLVHCVTTA